MFFSRSTKVQGPSAKWNNLFINFLIFRLQNIRWQTVSSYFALPSETLRTRVTDDSKVFIWQCQDPCIDPFSTNKQGKTFKVNCWWMSMSWSWYDSVTNMKNSRSLSNASYTWSMFPLSVQIRALLNWLRNTQTQNRFDRTSKSNTVKRLKQYSMHFLYKFCALLKSRNLTVRRVQACRKLINRLGNVSILYRYHNFADSKVVELQGISKL